MSLPVAAVAALVAALLETSVLTELTINGIKPDLVFIVTIVFATVVGFEEGLVLAVVGGTLVDVMSGRPIGATILALLVVTGLATLATRFGGGPRTLTALASLVVLAFVFQAAVLAILAVTSGVGIGDVPSDRLAAIAVLDLVVGAVILWIGRGMYRRFGPEDRALW